MVGPARADAAGPPAQLVGVNVESTGTGEAGAAAATTAPSGATPVPSADVGGGTPSGNGGTTVQGSTTVPTGSSGDGLPHTGAGIIVLLLVAAGLLTIGEWMWSTASRRRSPALGSSP
jgi:hypothetical protein